MTFCYLATFDVTDSTHGFGSVTLSTAGEPDAVLNIATLGAFNGFTNRNVTAWNHYPVALTNLRGEDQDANTGIYHSAPIWGFGERVRDTLRAAATTATWTNPSTVNVAFSLTTLRYTFSYTQAPLTAVTFSNAATRALFGFASNFSGSSTSVVGTQTPRFCLEPTMRAVSPGNDPLNVDPDDITPNAATVTGQRWGLRRTTHPLLRTWTQEFETYAKTIRLAASSAHPFTFQELFEACRTSLPFIVVDGWGDGRNEGFYFTEDGAHFSNSACIRAGGDMDGAMFHIRFNTIVAGRLIA